MLIRFQFIQEQEAPNIILQKEEENQRLIGIQIWIMTRLREVEVHNREVAAPQLEDHTMDFSLRPPKRS